MTTTYTVQAQVSSKSLHRRSDLACKLLNSDANNVSQTYLKKKHFKSSPMTCHESTEGCGIIALHFLELRR
jgi:hypothetical protein